MNAPRTETGNATLRRSQTTRPLVTDAVVPKLSFEKTPEGEMLCDTDSNKFTAWQRPANPHGFWFYRHPFGPGIGLVQDEMKRAADVRPKPFAEQYTLLPLHSRQYATYAAM